MLSYALVHLPDDILLVICLQVDLPTLLSLKQTCRRLHALCSCDYFWHQLIPNLPYLLPYPHPPSPPLSKLPAALLQRIAIRALRLAQNWSCPTTQIRCLTKASHSDGAYVDSMHLLPGAAWLLTAQRHRVREIEETRVSMWSISDVRDIRKAGEVHVRGRFGYFAATSLVDGKNSILAISSRFERHEALLVYTFPLEDRLDGEPMKPRLRGSISTLKSHGVIHEVAIHEYLAAATLVKLDTGLDPSYQILLFNVATGVRLVAKPRLPEGVTYVRIELHTAHISLICSRRTSLLTHTYPLPSSLLTPQSRKLSPTSSSTFTPSPFPFVFDTSSDGANNTGTDLGPPVTEQYTLPFPHIYDFSVSSTGEGRRLGAMSTLVSVAAFDSLQWNASAPKAASLFRFDLSPPPLLSDAQLKTNSISKALHSHSFTIGQGTSVDHVHVGPSGTRAVWLEYNWERDDMRMMKLFCVDPLSHSHSDRLSEVRTGVLLSAYPQLPFTPRAVQSLAFDEATGRLCLGLHTGELYILDF